MNTKKTVSEKSPGFRLRRGFGSIRFLERDAGIPTRFIRPQFGGRSLTIGEAYARFYEWKYGDGAARKLSKSSAAHVRSNAKKLRKIENRRMDDLSVDELQELVNSIHLRKTVVIQTITLLKQLYQYALSREYCTRNPAHDCKRAQNARICKCRFGR